MKELKSAGVFLRNRTDIDYRKYLTGSFKSLHSCFENPSLFSAPVTHTLFKVTVWTCWRLKQKKSLLLPSWEGERPLGIHKQW